MGRFGCKAVSNKPQTAINWFLYHDAQSTGQNVQSLAMQGNHFPIDHYVHCFLQMEFDAASLTNLGQRVLDMSAIVEAGQVPDESDSSNRPPPHEFDEAIVRICGWSDHHGPAGKLGVVEGEEQTRAAVNLLVAVHG
jgi:hypothetical protein